jgi:hypothetical protein
VAPYPLSSLLDLRAHSQATSIKMTAAAMPMIHSMLW